MNLFNLFGFKRVSEQPAETVGPVRPAVTMEACYECGAIYDAGFMQRVKNLHRGRDFFYCDRHRKPYDSVYPRDEYGGPDVFYKTVRVTKDGEIVT